ncbi:MAG: D-glucuronyl C5-epimerase family protein [Mastigocoleus sp. MO_188.B34]|nr:D-glucuronyl C5-epimerase family protein [Mastigocoleus sp. MO_188.B34]
MSKNHIKKNKIIVFTLFIFVILNVQLFICQKQLLFEQKLEKLSKHLEYIDSLSTIPSLDKLEWATYNTFKFKLKRYRIDLNAFNETGGVPRNWKIPVHNLNDSLESILPYNLPDNYIKKYKQLFSPWTFKVNAMALANVQTSNQAEYDALVKLKDKLIDRLLEFTVLQSQARYIIYKFDFPISDTDSVLLKPWVSGFAQGVTLSGLYHLYQRFGDERCLKIADEIFATFTQYRNKQNNKFWVTEIDESGYIWIEEYPLNSEPQPKVLNGHIHGILGVYDYYRMRPDNKDVLTFLQGAITTVHRYVNQYRKPGHINLYDLRFKKSDYGPQRTILQQKYLFDITGQPYFLKMSESFKKDFARASNNPN